MSPGRWHWWVVARGCTAASRWTGAGLCFCWGTLGLGQCTLEKPCSIPPIGDGNTGPPAPPPQGVALCLVTWLYSWQTLSYQSSFWGELRGVAETPLWSLQSVFAESAPEPGEGDPGPLTAPISNHVSFQENKGSVEIMRKDLNDARDLHGQAESAAAVWKASVLQPGVCPGRGCGCEP